MAARNPIAVAVRWSAADAEREIAAWRASGKSLAAYARERGVKVQRLHWWRHRLSGDAGTVSRAPLFAPAIIRSSSAVATLRIGADVALEIVEPSALAVEWLAALVIALGGSRR